MDSKQKRRIRRRHQEAFLRFFGSLLLVLAIHGLLGGLVWIKLQRTPHDSVPEEGGLRIWCMSSSDQLLTVEARDFLSMSEAVQEPLGRLQLASPSEYWGGSYQGGDFSSWETEKARLGIRLCWPLFTACLDSHLPQASLAVSSDHGLLGGSLRLGLGLEHDLGLYDLGKPWSVWSRQLSSGRPSWELVSRPLNRLGTVLVSRYANRTWERVEAPSLSAEATGVLTERLRQGVAADSLYRVWIEVLGVPGSGSRVHLRRSCGLRRLDDLSLRWVLERHRHLGHHHTDGLGIEGRTSPCIYMIEFGEPENVETVKEAS